MSVLGVNLHQMVRGAIPVLHPDEDVLIIQSTGNENKRGRVSPKYAEPFVARAQIQSVSNDDLLAMEESARSKITRRAYLFSETPNEIIPHGVVRSLQRGGDILWRPDDSFWLVTAMSEDFHASGWVCVQIVEQIEVPDEVIEMVAENLKKLIAEQISNAVEAYRSNDKAEIARLTDDELAKAMFDAFTFFHPLPTTQPVPEPGASDEPDGPGASGDNGEDGTNEEGGQAGTTRTLTSTVRARA